MKYILPTFHCRCHTKFQVNISIHDWIIIIFWNSRWRLSVILDFRKPNVWAMGPLGLAIFSITVPNLVQKMSIDAEIMAQNRNQRWRPSAILDFRNPDFWTLVPIRLPIFYHVTKFGWRHYYWVLTFENLWRSCILTFLCFVQNYCVRGNHKLFTDCN